MGKQPFRRNLKTPEKPISQKTQGNGQISEVADTPDNFFDSIVSGDFSRPGSGAGQALYHPDTTFGESQYDEDLRPQTSIEMENPADFFKSLENYRSLHQPVIDQLGNAALRLTNIVPEAIGGIAAVLDFEDYYNSDDEVGNGVTRLMNEWKEATNEEFPIYQSERGEAFNMTDSGWWIENGSNLVNSVAGFALTGGAVSKSIQGLSKLSKIKKLNTYLLGANRAAKAGEAAETLAVSLGLNQAEGILEATEVYDNTYQLQLDRLKGQYEGEELEQIARQKAADAATTTINWNRLNLFLNYTSSNLFVKNPTLTRGIVKKPVTFKSLGRGAVEGLQESAEEVINFVASKKGEAVGKDQEYGIQELVKDLSTPEAASSAFWGFLGGMGQTVITTEGIHRLQSTVDPDTGERMTVRNYNKMVYSRQKEILDSYGEEKFTEIYNGFIDQTRLQGELEKALKDENDEKARNIQDMMLSNQAYIAFKNGTTEIFEQYFKDIEKKEVGDADAEYRRFNAKKALERIKDLEQLYINTSARENAKELYTNRAAVMSYEDQFDDIVSKRSRDGVELNNKVRRINETRPEDDQLPIESNYYKNDVPIPEEIKKDPLLKKIKNYNKSLKDILHSVTVLNREYVGLDYKNRVKEFSKNQEERAERKLREQEAEEERIEKEAQKMDIFYSNLEEKGYPINRNDEGRIDSFGVDQQGAFIKGKDDAVFKVTMGKAGSARIPSITNVTTGDSFLLNPKAMAKYGLTNPDNVLSPEQYVKWEKMIKIKERNTERLNALNRLIGDHNRTKDRFVSETTDLIKELIDYNNEIQFWQNTSDFNMGDVKREIDRLIAKRDKVDARINVLNAKRQSLSDTLRILNDYRITLETLLSEPDNYEEFSFGQELKNLSDKLLKGDFDLDQIEISNSLDVVNEWIDELEDLKNTLQDTIDDLYDLYDESIGINSDILGGQGDFDQEWKFMRNAQRDILNQIDVKKADLKLVKDQLDRLGDEIKRLNENKELLVKYEKLKINLGTLEKRNNIKKNTEIDSVTSSNQKKDSPNDPVEQVHDNDSRDYKAEKSTPYSTITNVFKYDRDSGTLIYKDGIPQYSDNWQQAATWSRSMGKITMDKLDNYNLRFVNNDQLKELGQEPPVTDDNALYTVLYKGSEPYRSDDGLVYTGIAKVSTYYNTKFDEVEGKTDDEVKNEYADWRMDTLSKLDKGENLYSNITDISPGYARRDDIRKAPKSVFKVKRLQIPLKETILKANRGLQNVVKGMVYADIGNGQYERLLNHSINSLPEAKKVKKVNTILKLMGLAAKIDGNNFKQEFNYKNSKSRLPLVGQGVKTGVLDYYINWGNSKNNPQWNIAIYEKDGVKNIRFTHNGVTETLPLDVLVTGPNPNDIRQHGDPEIQTLVDFLETKYLNVVRNELNKTPKEGKAKWIPTGWVNTKNGPQLTFEKYKSYNDYVLENNLYTEVVKSDESLGELPSFVNQYATFDTNLKDKPNVKVVAPKVEPKKAPTNDLASQLLAAAAKPKQVKEEPSVKITEGNAAELLAGKLMDASLQNKAKEEPKQEEKHCEKKGGLKKKNRKKGNGGSLNFEDFA